MKNLRVLMVIGLLVAPVLSGCAASTSADGSPQVSSEGSAVGTAVDDQKLAGRWIAVVTTSNRWTETPFVRFEVDGSWQGSDGCNDQAGRWSTSSNKAFEASNGPSTQIGCDNVEVGSWLAAARSVELEGNLLTFRGADNSKIGQLLRSKD